MDKKNIPPNDHSSGIFYSLTRFAGSLWFAAVLMTLLLVALVCASIFEVMYGSELALVEFYRAWWFEGLLFLVAMNVFSSLVIRLPFSRRQIGFAVAHISILLVLAGAFITKHFGIDGQITLAEGQTAQTFDISRQILSVSNLSRQRESTFDLNLPSSRNFKPLDYPIYSVLNLDNLTIEIQRYLPASLPVRQVFNDNPDPNHAVEISLSPNGYDKAVWIFADPTAEDASDTIRFRLAADRKQLDHFLNPPPATSPADPGTLKIRYQNIDLQIPVRDALKSPVKVGNADLTVRVLRYMPHAVVDAAGRVANASDQPVNPAVEVEFVASTAHEKRLAFAHFPDFAARHRKQEIIPGLSLVYDQSPKTDFAVPVEIVSGPDGDLYVRFNSDGKNIETRKITVGTPIDSPWTGQKFQVLRRFDHARLDWKLVPDETSDPNRIPGLLLNITANQTRRQLWIQKQWTREITIDGQKFEFKYTNKNIPLGFDLTLDRFRIGYYPGGDRPKSFESLITIRQSPAQQRQTCRITMNHPVTYGGYSFYQASYNQEDGHWVSVLSVTRDPGKPLVFVGYIGMFLGMLFTIRERRNSRKNEISDLS